MNTGCPIGSSEAWQIGLLRCAEEAATATACPIVVEELAQVETLPQRGADQGKEPGEAVAPLAQEGAEAQQQIDQQRGPHLPAHGVGVVAEEVGQLQRLFEFLEEHLNLPAAAIEVGNGLCAPHGFVGQKDHLPEFALNLDPCDHLAQFDRIGFASRPSQMNQIVAQAMAVSSDQEAAHDAKLHVFLGAGDPEDLAHGQIGQMREIHISLVEDHNLPGSHACAHFPCS